MAVTMADITKLRKMTGAGMMDCKNALTDAEGDFDKAMKIIREKGQAVAAKRSDREASEGCVLVKVEEGFGAIIALKCETDFVAQNADFVKLTQDILDAAVANKCKTLEEVLALPMGDATVAQAVTDRTGITGEKMELDGYMVLEGATIAAYNHMNRNGLCTMVAFNKKVDEQLAKQVAMQVAAMNPIAVDEAGVPADVLEKENTKISRNDLGFPERKCLLCDNPACQCGRSRKHSIEELRKKIYDIIWEEQLQRGVAAEISQALMEEVYTTPKPGLVDREDTGAHTDMDCQTFQKSTEAIAEDLAAMFEAGYSWEADPETLFPLLRERGKKTEEKMLAATGGVNTHKGIIFTIGILAAAAGISLRNYGKIESESVCRISLEMTKKELEQDLRKLKQSSGITHGEKIYCHLGEKGVRGLAMTGYPILCELTVPHMKQYIANNRDKNQINVQILLEIIAELTDTNVISRTSEKEMRWLQTEAKAILKAGGAFSENGLQKVRELNQICIRKNMSPGGAADLLAATIFLCRMETLMERRKGILQ